LSELIWMTVHWKVCLANWRWCPQVCLLVRNPHSLVRYLLPWTSINHNIDIQWYTYIYIYLYIYIIYIYIYTVYRIHPVIDNQNCYVNRGPLFLVEIYRNLLDEMRRHKVLKLGEVDQRRSQNDRTCTKRI
jgi:hypothetical protein